jgi:hypothetical protein
LPGTVDMDGDTAVGLGGATALVAHETGSAECMTSPHTKANDAPRTRITEECHAASTRSEGDSGEVALEPGHFGEVKTIDLHRGDNHIECFLTGSADRG